MTHALYHPHHRTGLALMLLPERRWPPGLRPAGDPRRRRHAAGNRRHRQHQPRRPAQDRRLLFDLHRVCPQIREVQPTSTADLLKIVPGVWVESSGGQAGANVFIRGFPRRATRPS
jgi:hypothetical protein